MPSRFKEYYPQTVLIIDCTEIEMEKPSALDNQSACYSSYKSRTTMKSLIGTTPSRATAFVSERFPCSSSDEEVTVKSGLLNLLQLVLRLLRYAIGLKKLAPLFHPIRSKTKTNHDSLVRVFPRFASATCNYFVF